jgi:hypothetical protein
MKSPDASVTVLHALSGSRPAPAPVQFDGHRAYADNSEGSPTSIGGAMARRTLTGSLNRAARISATGRAVRTGHAGRRAKNIAVGRALGKAGFWSRLWK